MIYSFDVCSGCETHHIIDQLESEWKSVKQSENKNFETIKWIESKMENLLPLSEWKKERNEVHYKKCPTNLFKR